MRTEGSCLLQICGRGGKSPREIIDLGNDLSAAEVCFCVPPTPAEYVGHLHLENDRFRLRNRKIRHKMAEAKWKRACLT